MNIRSFTTYLALVLVLAGCVKSPKTTDPKEYAEYISGFTAGIISKADPLRIRLAVPVTKYEAGKTLPPGIFAFNPPVKGTAILSAGDLIEFRPEKEWPAGKSISADFNLGKIFELPSKLRLFTFEFRTIRPSFSVNPGNIISTGDRDKKMIRIEGKLVSADVMSLEDVGRSLRASANSKDFTVIWEKGDGINEFFFLIDSLPRKEKAYTVDLRWDGKPLGIDVKGNHSYEIPSVFDFLYMGYTINLEDEQYIDLIISDPVDPSQDLNGLVYLKGGESVRLVATNNIIRLYPAQRLEGPAIIVIESSVRNEDRISLKERVEFEVVFEELKPAVEFTGQGVIMPDPDGLLLPFRVVNLRAVDATVYKVFENNIPYLLQENGFEDDYLYNFKAFGRPVYAKTLLLDEDRSRDLHQWNTFALDLSPLVSQDPGAVYRVKLSFRKEYSVFSCGAAGEKDITEFILDGKVPPEKLEPWDSPGWFQEDEWPEEYRWEQRNNPCDNSYYYPDRFRQKLILSTSIGVIAKSADGRNFVIYTTDLLTGDLLGDVKVDFFNYQNQPVGSIRTGTDGRAEITLDNRPFYLKASKNRQQSWLRIHDGSSLSLSNFDVGGSEVQKGLKGMIYGERGVWRPGDTLFLTFILDDREKRLPPDHPVRLELYNARGQLAYSTKKANGTDGFYPFAVPTHPDAPTGNWRAVARAGGASFEKSLRIETVKPNRLKINLDFNQEVLNTFSQKPEGKAEVRWLHGAVAPGIRTSINLSFRKSRTGFKGFEKFSFDNPATYFWSDERNIFDKELDNQGKAVFSFELPGLSNAPGMMDAVFLVRAFEKGGDFSTDVFTRQFSPFRKYAGIYVPGGGTYDKMLETDKDQRIEVACLDWQGNPVTAIGLEVKVYKIEWRWWWGSGEEDLAQYVGSQDAEVVYQGVLDANGGKGSFDLRIGASDWGRYLIMVREPEGGHQAGLTVYFDWPSYVDRSGRANPAGATMLTFTADKEKYNIGDRAIISFPASPGSRAMISIESGSKVVDSRWKMCRAPEESFEVDIKEGMAPNVYVYLSLVRPHEETEGNLPIRMYGVVPLLVEDPSTILEPVISMPEELEPGEDFKVKVYEKNGKAMTFTVAVVDEGLLDLTRFKTPDPHGVFYAREALGVKTWDLFDLVLGASGSRFAGSFAIGGDEEAMMAKERKARRFEPVVKYAGPFSIKKGEKKEISLKMPNYVGSVRTMVIAGKDGAYGMAGKSTPVRKPLMVLATLPRVLGPGEEAELPVSVFALTDDIKEVTVRTETSGLECISAAEAALSFLQTGEKMAWFRLKAGNATGTGKIKVTAVSGNESAYQEFEIGIRNPNPFITKSYSFIAEPGQETEVPYAFFGMNGSNKGTATVSSFPDFGLEKHLEYLLQYPYGCLEQIVSGVFPQLVLPELMDLSQEMLAKTDRNIRAAITRIAGLALPDGSMAYWPGQPDANSWSTSYAGHFLVLAANKGYVLPPGLVDQWKDFQFRRAGIYQPGKMTAFPGADIDQAYRLYTLALAQKPNLNAMNRMREAGSLSPTSAWILAGAYLYAGKPEVATELVAGINAGETDRYPAAGMTYGSELRDKAFTLEVLSMLGRDSEAFKLAEQMAEELRSGMYSTQTTAFCLSAIARYAGKNAGKGISFEYLVNSANKQSVSTSRTSHLIGLDEKSGMTGRLLIKNNSSESRLFIGITTQGQALQGDETEASSGLKLNVRYTDDIGNAIDIASLRQGTGFIAEVTVEHPGVMFGYNNLALSQVFPSGWEIINTRAQDVDPGIKEDVYDYRDIRDDRVNTFFSLEQSRKKTFRIRLNAAYAGRYYLPAVKCEGMYETDIHANTRGRWIEVVR